jgi:23S rRNA A1618 N6-methylase RlmF
VLLDQQLFAAVQHGKHDNLSTSKSSKPAREVAANRLVSVENVPMQQPSFGCMPGCWTHIRQQVEYWQQLAAQRQWFTPCQETSTMVTTCPDVSAVHNLNTLSLVVLHCWHITCLPQQVPLALLVKAQRLLQQQVLQQH